MRASTNFVKIFLSSIIFVLLFFIVPTRNVEASTPNYTGIMADESYWISLAQIPPGHGNASGAIAITINPANGIWLIRPYDANIGARGMLAAGSYYYPMVKAWMQWYLNHVNWPDYNGTNATVYDYYINSTTYAETYAPNPTTPSYDSTDSYAATFLTLAQAYAQTTGDYTFLQQNQYLINAIGDAMQATKQTDGLTWAKPDWTAKYLMDNSEVYQGIMARSWLDSNVFSDSSGASYYANQAQDVKNGIQNSLWESTPAMYSPAKSGSGTLDVPSWSQWYPSSIGQIYPTESTVIASSSAQSQQLWSDLNANWSNWTTTINNPTGTPGMIVCYSAALMADKTRTDACLNGAVTNWTSNGRSWPWTVFESGMMILAAQKGQRL